MPRYIDANPLYDAVEQRYRMSSGDEHRCERDLLDLICDQPTVSPDEVRGVGKWIMSEKFKGYAMCSRCEDAYVDPEWIYKDGKWNYCPNCGAKMEVSEDER